MSLTVKETEETYRNNKGRSGKSESGDLGSIGAFLSEVLEISLKRARHPGSGGLDTEGLAEARRRL